MFPPWPAPESLAPIAPAKRAVSTSSSSTGDETPDHASMDASAVQAAIDAAAPDSLLKIAGVCAGVSNADGHNQTAYVNKALTLRGGYTLTNWIAPDPEANPTVLDAGGQGRVIYIADSASPTVTTSTG